MTVALTQLATQMVFREFVTEQYTRSLLRLATYHLSTVGQALRALPPDARAGFARDLERTQNLTLVPATSLDLKAPDTAQPLPERLGRLQQLLAERLGPGTELRLEANRDPPRVWARLPVAGGDWWLVFERTHFDRAFPLSAVLLLALSMCVAVAVAWLIVRRFNRPLREVQRNILALSVGAELPHSCPNVGLAEINDLARAVERTSAALRVNEQERALLLAGISHDLRTPLSRVRLALEMLGVGSLEDHEAMVGDLEEIDRIIDQFLDFARNASGVLPIRGDLSDVVRECGTRARQHIPGIDLELEPGLTIDMRRPALDRMITNLVENANRHARPPIVLQTLREQDHAVLSVLDRGPGIPVDEVPRLLQPFTRLDVSRTGPGGAGLGLAIVDRIARAHGGRLELLPREGGGLHARIRLPLALPDPAPDRLSQPQGAPQPALP